ncbi:MAG TPA: hypothetical protein VJU61_09005 [Polyangiaceae bacterium]|nr:hypothetical protein [Polyangiaceae bacterium]
MPVLRPLPAPVVLICSLLACGGAEEDRYSAEQCQSMRDDIMTTLQDNVAKGIIVGSAVPCGSDGLASSAASFDSRATPEDVEELQNAFREACEEFDAHC